MDGTAARGHNFSFFAGVESSVDLELRELFQYISQCSVIKLMHGRWSYVQPIRIYSWAINSLGTNADDDSEMIR